MRAKIREEVGDAKFCILIDEAVDESNKEQMTIILRYIDLKGFVRERFFQVMSVTDTNSSTLKKEISNVLTRYNLSNGMVYKPYFSKIVHMLITFIALHIDFMHNIWLFFSKLNSIVNFVGASSKCHSQLKSIREDEIKELITLGELETATGANQIRTLQRPGVTHFGNILSSLSIFAIEISRNLKCYEFGVKYKNAPSRFYFQDFDKNDIEDLRRQLNHYRFDVICSPKFQNFASLSELCQCLVETKNLNSSCIHSNNRMGIFCYEACQNTTSQ
ncbi:hypothetical protein ACOSQ3_031591 [Xanthoceras sorbifolium]